MTDRSSLVLALTTEGDQDSAEALAETLLKRRLVACVSLQPQRSLYRWRGHLERESEVQMLLKTSAAGLELLRETVMDLHSYDTPEWLTWSVEASGAYGAWTLAQLSSDGLWPAPAGTPGDEPPAG